MSLIKRSVNVGAGTEILNVLAGSIFEFVQAPSRVRIGLLASATGLLASVSSGKDILLEPGSLVDIVRTANQGPIFPDDFLLDDVAMPGDRLAISVRNPTGGAIVLFYGVIVEEMA
mgnify:CR=1 FL=1